MSHQTYKFHGKGNISTTINAEFKNWTGMLELSTLYIFFYFESPDCA